MHAILNFAFLTSILGYITQVVQMLGFRSNNLWGVAYNLAFVITTANEHLWFNALVRSLLIILFILSYTFWKNSKWRYRFSSWHLIPFILIFIIMYIKLHSSDASPLLDATSATFGLIGTFMAAMRNKYAFVLFFIGNGLDAIMFYHLGGTNINLAIMETVFCLSNIPAFVIWTKRKIHR